MSLSIIVGLLSFLWYQKAHSPVTPQADITVTLKAPSGEQHALQVELADDNEERSIGLMGRATLEPGRGMLFVFEGESTREFWMKNTLIPLDILFFDARGEFVSRTTMEPCHTSTCSTYPSEGPAMYVLEVNTGEALTADVGDGWTISL